MGPNRIDNKTAKYKFSSMWDRSKFPSKSKGDMEPAEKLKHDCEALLTCALKPMEETVDGKTVQAFVVGKTRSYFRLGALEYLEANRTKEMGSQVVSIQRYIRGWFIRKDHQQADNKRRKAVARIQKWYETVKREIASAEKAKKGAAERKKREEREKKAREKVEAKTKAALQARLKKEKVEREARMAREKEEEEERERNERKKEKARMEKEEEALGKLGRTKEKKIKKYKKDIKTQEKELDDKDKRWTNEINELEEECEKAEVERDDILEQIAREEAKLASFLNYLIRK